MSETRRVPIFPLPETVFFPSVPLPLHLFEPRYLQMAEDVLSGDERLVIVLLRPGWQKDYYGDPPVHDIATLGSVESHERLPDGRFNVTLRGLERVRLLPAEGEERTAGRLYRVRPILPAPEKKPPHGLATVVLSDRLRSLWRELGEKSGRVPEEGLALERLGFDTLVNGISNLVDLPPATKQLLLEQDDLLLRAAKLEAQLEESLRFFRSLARFRRVAPADPSVN